MVFRQKNWKNVNGTQDPPSPLPFMANAIKNFHFFGNPYLIWTTWCVRYVIWHLQLWPLFLLLMINRFDAVDPQLGQSPVCRRGLEFTQSWSCSLNLETNFQLFSAVGAQVTQNLCAFHSHYWHRFNMAKQLYQEDTTEWIYIKRWSISRLQSSDPSFP